MTRRVLAFAVVAALSLALLPGNMVASQAQATQREVIVKGKQPFSTRKGLYLKRGVGARGGLEIGWAVDTTDSVTLSRLAEYKESYGVEYGLDTSLHIIRFLKCNQPNCYTDNNIAVGELLGTVYRRFGKPLQSKPNKAKQERFLAYEGVAFMIGPDDRVKEIYILPLPPRKGH